MSAMPARAPHVSRPVQPQLKTRTNRKRRLSTQLTRTLSPALETINDAVPEGKANRKTFGFFIVGLLSLGLISLLFVNTLTAKASFEKRQLQLQVSTLTAQQQQLQREVALKESPGELLKTARKMGMVPAATPAFLRLSDHKILGVPQAATAGQ